MAIRLPQQGIIVPTAMRIARVSFAKVLDEDELLVGSVAAIPNSGDIVVTNAARNAAPMKVRSETVAIDKAISFLVDGTNAVLDSVYEVLLTISTTSDPYEIQTFVYRIVCSNIVLRLPPISAGARRNIAIDYTNEIHDDETLTGSTPNVNKLSAEAMVIENETPSTADLPILNKIVPAGKALQFTAKDGVAGVDYRLKLSVFMPTNPPQRLVHEARMLCE